MNLFPRRFRRPLLGSIAVLLLPAAPVFAQTWTGNSGSDWNTFPNWTGNSVPTVTATFATSSSTSVTISANTSISNIVFNPGASAYTITVNPVSYPTFTISGSGITNNSGVIQNFITSVDGNAEYGSISFTNSASAGSNTAFNNYGAISAGDDSGGPGGATNFYNTSTAGNATFTNNGGTINGASGGSTSFNDNSTAGNGVFTNNGGTANGAYSGSTSFYDNSTAGNGSFTNIGSTINGASSGATYFNDNSSAGNATFTNTAATAAGGSGGNVYFYSNSTAGNAVITNSGAIISGAQGGATYFNDTSTAGASMLIATGGSNGGLGGGIYFFDQATGGTARVVVNGNGFLDISNLSVTSLTVGSIEGTGNVFLGGNNLTVGSSNLSTSFSGVIQDGGQNGGVGGSLTKTGTGILTLTGTNTYTGGTFINGGLINFNSLSNFGTGGITLNGGGLQWAAGTSTDISSRLGAIGSAGATFDTNGSNVTFASALTGSGGLTKAGAGLLDLAGASTYMGPTVVSAGTLWVDGSIASPSVTVTPGGLLGGHGIIMGNVVNNGVVSPGNSPGALTINGNYNQGSSGTLVIEVGGFAPNQHDLLKVGGSATLGGTLQLQPLNGFKFTGAGQQITFLTAGSGVTGKFAVVQNASLLDAQVIYLPYAVELESLQGSPTSPTSIFGQLDGVPGVTQNDLQTARLLDSAASNPAAANLFKVLGQATLPQLIKDVELIDPGQLAALSNIGSALSNQVILSLTERFEAIEGLPITPGPGGPAGPDGKGGKEVAPPAANRWGSFITGSGDFERMEDTSTSRGFNFGSGGVTFGVDYRFGDHFVAGLLASYLNTGIDIANRGRIDVNTGKWGLYGTYFDGGFYINSAAEGGYTAYDTHRNALFGTARGSTEGGDVTLLFAPGYNWTMGGLTFGPTSRFQYSYQNTDGFAESGSLAPVTVSSQHTESIVGAFGMKASYDWKIGGVTVRPELRLEWEHEYGDTATGIDAQLASGAGNAFRFTTPTIGRDDLHLGSGVAVVFSELLTAYFYYDGQFFRTNYDSSTITGGFRVSF